MSNWGIPYMGSKSKICEKVCALFPKAENFYDLFGGGFSITHFMIEKRKNHYKNFHFNEIRPGVCSLIQEAISGKYNCNAYQPPWISREDFFRLKEVDPMVKIIWSFGNNGEGYLFGKGIEQDKKSMHMAVVFNEFDDYAKEVFGMEKFRDGFDVNAKRLFLKNRIRLLGKDRLDLERLEQLQQRIVFYNSSYEQVPIRENSIIYCDIPYIGTADYGSSFKHKEFYNWADSQNNPVFISEYRLDDSRFKCIANFQKRSLLSSNKAKSLTKTEKVFVNKSGYEKLMSRK